MKQIYQTTWLIATYHIITTPTHWAWLVLLVIACPFWLPLRDWLEIQTDHISKYPERKRIKKELEDEQEQNKN
jgi:hypothetical protein